MSDSDFFGAVSDVLEDDTSDVFDDEYTRSKEITEQLLMK